MIFNGGEKGPNLQENHSKTRKVDWSTCVIERKLKEWYHLCGISEGRPCEVRIVPRVGMWIGEKE